MEKITTGDVYTISKAIRDKLDKPRKLIRPFIYFGGKSKLAAHIINILPRGKVYVEPFCGSAAVFWALDRPYQCEVLNDINDLIITTFRVLQDKAGFSELAHMLTWTPYSRKEFIKAIDIINNPDNFSSIQKAWGTIVAFNFAASGNPATVGNLRRSFTITCGIADPCNGWLKRLAILEKWHNRLMRVQIDNRDALEVIKYWDSNDTVFYIDPPYVHSTRRSGQYKHELDDEYHKKLVNQLLTIKGNAVLSGYDNIIYKPLEEAGWGKKEIKVYCGTIAKTRNLRNKNNGGLGIGTDRTEVLWVKKYDMMDLFSQGAAI